MYKYETLRFWFTHLYFFLHLALMRLALVPVSTVRSVYAGSMAGVIVRLVAIYTAGLGTCSFPVIVVSASVLAMHASWRWCAGSLVADAQALDSARPSQRLQASQHAAALSSRQKLVVELVALGIVLWLVRNAVQCLVASIPTLAGVTTLTAAVDQALWGAKLGALCGLLQSVGLYVMFRET